MDREAAVQESPDPISTPSILAKVYMDKEKAFGSKVLLPDGWIVCTTVKHGGGSIAL